MAGSGQAIRHQQALGDRDPLSRCERGRAQARVPDRESGVCARVADAICGTWNALTVWSAWFSSVASNTTSRPFGIGVTIVRGALAVSSGSRTGMRRLTGGRRSCCSIPDGTGSPAVARGSRHRVRTARRLRRGLERVVARHLSASDELAGVDADAAPSASRLLTRPLRRAANHDPARGESLRSSNGAALMLHCRKSTSPSPS